MGTSTYIEINGKRYDTVTGKQLSSTQTPANVTSVKPTISTGSIDGFSRRKTTTNRTSTKHTSKNQQRSQTLMRKSVKKPAITAAPHAKVEKNVISKSTLGSHPRRLESAKQSVKNPHINKYKAHPERTSTSKQHAELPLKQEPSQTYKAPAQARLPKVSAITPAQKRKLVTERMIESALHNSQSHHELHHAVKPLANKRRKSFAKRLGVSSRSIAMSSAVLAVVLLAGFFALQNVPNFAMRVAATRAGFDAELPGYKPAGFSFKGPINYSSGKVTVSFKSNTDTRAYDVTQQSSKWNSDALLSNYVIAENKQYQTYQDRGRTLYIYDGSNATWVDNGIWYQIQGESNMTTDQLVRIASSI